MVTCQSCGYISPETSKFCRQCGALLISDGDPMEAATRNYGRQSPAVATAGSAPLPPSIGDAVAGETARYPRAPQASLHVYSPPGTPAAAPDTASLKPKRRRRRILKWGAIFMAMMMSMGVGALINEEANSGRVLLEREDEIRLERLRTEDRMRTAMTGSAVEQQERLRREIESRLEAVERASRDAERAAERGEDVLTGGEKPLDLAAYEYKGASTGQFSRIPGRELLKQSTKDEFEAVSRYYQEKLGKPFVYVNERNRKQSLFQIPGTPSVTVLVRQARDRGANQTEILVMRSPFRFPVTETVEVPNAPPAPPPAPPPPAVVR